MQSDAERARRLEGYLRMDPHNAELLRELADLQRANGEGERALTLYTQLLEEQGESPQTLNQIAVVHLDAGRFDVAAELLARAVALDPTRAALHFNRARAEFARGHLTESLNAVTRATELDTANSLFFYYLSLNCDAAGDAPGAAHALARCLEIDPQHCEGNVLAAYNAVEAAQFDTAARIVDATTHAHPESVAALELKAQLELLRFEQDQALATLRRALALQPNNPDLRALEGQVLLALQRYRQAHGSLGRAAQLDPNNGELQAALGWACVLTEDAPGARAAFEAAIRLDAANADAWAGLALIHTADGHGDDAQRALDTALAANPECASALWIKAGLAGLGGDEATRRSMLQRFTASHAFGATGWTHRDLMTRAGSSAATQRAARKIERYVRRKRGRPPQSTP